MEKSVVDETLQFHITCSASTLPSPEPLTTERVLHAHAHDQRFDEVRLPLWETKKKLDAIRYDVYRRARDTLFPLAHSGSGVHTFTNRAGHKLQEAIDATNLWETLKNQSADRLSKSLSNENKKKKPSPIQLYFADVCGGPGSFSQLLYQNHPRCFKLQGFGLTLMDEHTGAKEGWYPDLMRRHGFLTSFGIDGKGDIYNPGNIEAFASMTRGKPIKLVVADGGFEVAQSQANLQEILSDRIVFAQWYVALRLLCEGGCFVLKLFDTFAPLMRSLIYLSAHFFEFVHIVKPKHSRVVNSERYLVGLNLKGAKDSKEGSFLSPEWLSCFARVHQSGFDELQEIQSLLPLSIMKGDEAFCTSFDDMVKVIAEREKLALQQILASTLIPQSSSCATAEGGEGLVAEESRKRSREVAGVSLDKEDKGDHCEDDQKENVGEE